MIRCDCDKTFVCNDLEFYVYLCVVFTVIETRCVKWVSFLITSCELVNSSVRSFIYKGSAFLLYFTHCEIDLVCIR